MVTFEGSDYTLVGFYFAPSHNGHNGMRDLFFILCQLPDKSGDVPVRPGELAREPNAGGGDGDQGLR